MHILYIGNFNPHSVGEPEIASALEKLGHKVTRLQELNCTVKLAELRLAEHNPDVLLYAKLRIGSNPEVRDFLRRVRIPKVCWVFDLYWGYNREEQISKMREPIFFNSDLVLTTDGGHQEQWEKYNINHKVLRQGIADDVVMGTSKTDYKYKIGFVGSINTWAGWTYRAELINWLQNTYPYVFHHIGQSGKVRHQELNDYLASWSITIGDSVNSPFYWSNRIYEMLGRGAFLIHPDIVGLSEEFEPYKHFIPYRYRDWRGLKEKIDYYLTHDEEREKIRQAGFEHCHKHHTYTHRAKVLISIINKELLCQTTVNRQSKPTKLKSEA